MFSFSPLKFRRNSQLCHIYVQKIAHYFPSPLCVNRSNCDAPGFFPSPFRVRLCEVPKVEKTRFWIKIFKDTFKQKENCNSFFHTCHLSSLGPRVLLYKLTQHETNNRNNISLQLVVRLHKNKHTLYFELRETQIVVCIPNSDIVFTAKIKT